MKPPYAIGSVPSLSGPAIAYRWRSLPRVRRHRASKPQGSSERVLPWQVTMDQETAPIELSYNNGQMCYNSVRDESTTTFTCSSPDGSIRCIKGMRYKRKYSYIFGNIIW